ncbi:MAG TPA: pitrilysin family protein, partial [Myxococcaceae bacterium]|nr:pitrilysin family protein [Myxococcaceae bacterium]
MPRRTPSASLKEVRLPPSKSFVTPTGLTVLAAERGPLPLVALRLTAWAGSAADPRGKRGLADFAVRLLRRGTRSAGAEAINEAVERVGGTLSMGAGEDTLALHINAPAEHVGPMLKVLASLVCEPSFPQKEVRTARERLLASLANDLDDPSSLADRAMSQAYWGNHPYAHDTGGTRTDVEGFTRGDVVRFHREVMGPRVSLLSVVGAVDVRKLRGQVEKAFRPFRGGPSQPPVIPALEQVPSASVVVVDKPEQSQSQVRLVGRGMPRRDPDFMASKVLETILGGGFTSRLMETIRVNRGLSYSVGAAFDRHRADGNFLIATFTKTGSTREIIDAALDEVRGLREGGPTDAEMNTAKQLLVGLYPLRFETNDSIAAALADLRMYEMGEDWVERYRSRVQAVTAEEVGRVADKYLFPQPPLVVVVGNAKAVLPQLKGLGKVKVVRPSE